MSLKRPSITINGEIESENVSSQDVPIESEGIMSDSDCDEYVNDGSDGGATEETIIDVQNSSHNDLRAPPMPEKTNLVLFLNLTLTLWYMPLYNMKRTRRFDYMWRKVCLKSPTSCARMFLFSFSALPCIHNPTHHGSVYVYAV